MTTQFTYLNKKYTVNIDLLHWYEKSNLVKLPNGDILALNHLKRDNTPYVTPIHIIEATEVSEEERCFQSLLQFHKLTDNPKTRKLWVKCCALAGYQENTWNQEIYENVKEYWKKLIDLIID